MGEEASSTTPAIRLRINAMSLADVSKALKDGWQDFRRYPLYGLFFGGIYAVGGLFIAITLVRLHMPWLIIPVAIGFPLIGPFVAVGLYEISRRHKNHEPVTWRAVLMQAFSQRERQMSWMAFVVLFIFWIWIYQVRLLLALFLGFRLPSSLEAFVHVVTTTPSGLAFLAVGTIVGAVLATILFSVTVISMPLLLEHDIDFITAMLTSLKVVIQNPGPMLSFGVIVALAAFAAMVPAFIGLVVALPVLGHATWHLYQEAISPN